MKQFLIKIGYIFLSAIIILVVLDIVYTYNYKHPHYTRSKVSWLRTLDGEKEYDYAVFGSSRVYYNFDPLLVERKTGVKGLNLGYPGANNFEIKLMIKSFLKKYKTKRIFIQVDDQYNKYHYDPVAIIPFMPFIREPDLFKDISEVNSDASFLYYLPFYRYMKYDSKLGFRELVMSFYKKNQYEKRLGHPIASSKQMNETTKKYEFQLSDQPNKHIEEIVRICKEKNIQVYFYTAPIYKAEGNLEVLEKNLPNYHDFSDSFDDAKFFRDPYHLNDVGTAVFTEQFIDIYFKP